MHLNDRKCKEKPGPGSNGPRTRACRRRDDRPLADPVPASPAPAKPRRPVPKAAALHTPPQGEFQGRGQLVVAGVPNPPPSQRVRIIRNPMDGLFAPIGTKRRFLLSSSD